VAWPRLHQHIIAAQHCVLQLIELANQVALIVEQIEEVFQRLSQVLVDKIRTLFAASMYSAL